MAITPEEALAAGTRGSGYGVVTWGERVVWDGPGIYVVSLPKGSARNAGSISLAKCEELLSVRPELKLDGTRPDAQALRDRIAGFWVPVERVLYIGLAGTSVSSRTHNYYRTPLGARAPHSGGWFLKTLDCISELEVHYASSDEPRASEADALAEFAEGVSSAARARLHDDERVMPFANLEYPQGVRKSHGITGARQPHRARSTRTQTMADDHAQRAWSDRGSRRPSTDTGQLTTQRVTAADRKRGQIRIPVASKAAFPAERDHIVVELRGLVVECRWDPRPSRSGVIGIGKAIVSDLVGIDEVLQIEVLDDRVKLI